MAVRWRLERNERGEIADVRPADGTAMLMDFAAGVVDVARLAVEEERARIAWMVRRRSHPNTAWMIESGEHWSDNPSCPMEDE